MYEEQTIKEFRFEGVFGRPHPLLIPSIVHEIMGYLKFSQLKTCRLVCQDWQEEAYRCMQGHARVRITNYKRLKDYFQNFNERKDFCSVFEFGRSLNVGAPLMVAFFNAYGPFIESLALERTKWREDELSELMFKKLTNLSSLTLDCVPRGDASGRYFQNELPNQLAKLKVLNINIHSWESNFQMHPANTMKAFLLDLFAAAPNLEIVACPKSDSNYQPLEFLFPMDPVHVNHFINGEVRDALDELNGMGFESNIRRVLFDTLVSNDSSSPKLQSLAELDVSMTLREEHIRKLQIKSFPLQRLDIIITQNVTLTTLHDFISSISQSLQSLSLRFLRRSMCTWEFPSASALINLRTLKITGFKGSLQFIQHFTKLDTLIIVNIPKLSLSFPHPTVYPAPLKHMRVLEIFEIEKMCSRALRPLLIQQWATNFPNLKRLRLENICDQALREIYLRIPGLEELFAPNGDFTDAGLTGLSQEKCKGISSTANFDAFVTSDIQPSTSISSLRYLKKLELGSKNLTDVGICLGISGCRSLKSLSIITYWMTDRSLRKIANTLDLDVLKTEFCFQLTLEVVKFVMENMKGCDISINEYEGPMKSSEMWKFLKRNQLKLVVNKLPAQVPYAEPGPSAQY